MDRRPVRFSSAWSVGRVLATVFGSPDFIPAVYLKRGADIHRWTEHYDLGQVYRPEEDLAGWCDAYKAFTYAHAPSWHDNGIETVIHYPTPIHLQPASESLGYKVGDFPMAEKQAQQILTLPVNQSLEQKDIEKIISIINRFFSN